MPKVSLERIVIILTPILLELTGGGTENPEGVIGTELYHDG